MKVAVLVKGYLYILSNPAMPGLLKIGLTVRTVPDRVSELSAATGLPSAFAVEAYFESSDPQQHEKTVHLKLQKRRVAGKGFFRVRLDEAVEQSAQDCCVLWAGREGEKSLFIARYYTTASIGQT